MKRIGHLIDALKDVARQGLEKFVLGTLDVQFFIRLIRSMRQAAMKL